MPGSRFVDVEQKSGASKTKTRLSPFISTPLFFCLPLFCLSELTKILTQASVYLVYVLHET